ncbi:plasmid rolling circle replication initiator protein Rep [Bradyrhizobium sp. LB8.2]|uniref:protein rep n=1 Tax=unclassified Bradyrhizobium TaxID=2631580 RepID=UPI003399A441
MLDLFNGIEAETLEWVPSTHVHRLPSDEAPYFCDEIGLPDVGKKLAKIGKRDYRRMHLEKIALADSLKAAGRDDVANLLSNCCTQLFLDRYTKGVRLRGVNECKHPLCPTAQLARGRRLYGETSASVERFLGKHDGMQGLLLTLTERSCPAHELNYRLGEILRAFSRLMSFTKVKRAVKAYVRSVEFTRNAITGLWHAHIHVCIFVSKAEYFRRGSKLYISQEQWAALWRKALRATYTPVVDIRALKGLTSPLTDKGRDALCEVIKYQVKPGSLIYWQNGKAFAVGRQTPELYRKPGDDTLQPMINVPVMAFCDAVKGRRLVATSRNLQGNDDLDFTDDPRDEVKALDLGEFICTETYQWHTRGRDAGFYLVGRSFDEPGHSRRGGPAMGP